MNRFNYFILIVIIGLAGCRTGTANKEDVSLKDQQNVQTIAFGSCNKQDAPQPLWKSIISHKPDVWIWLGDNIYGDTDDMNLLKEKYELQLENSDYKSLTASSKVVGIWDDHDYGKNDAGKEFNKKIESRELMYNFLGVDEDDEIRRKEGGYSAHVFGKGSNKVKIILLDARYFRDELQKDDNKAYIPNENGTILGETQWKWLEDELRKKDAAITLVGSGIQFIPEEHEYEKWQNFPNERKRLFDLLKKTGTNGAILLSGDRHIAEISKMELDSLNHPLYDVTSSGLTHTWKEVRDEPNKHRIGDLVARLNYGLLHFDWQDEEVIVTMEIRGEGSELYLSEKLVVKR